MVVFIAFMLLFLTYIRLVNTNVVPGSGDFKITGIFPITNTDESNINFQAGIMMQAAMNYAIAKVNNMSGSNYLYGYTLTSNDVAVSDGKGGHKYSKGNYPTELHVREGILQSFLQSIPFIIGPYSSELAYVSSILTGTFQTLSISYAASYSKFNEFRPEGGFMFRTVPSDVYRIEAVLELLKRLQWNYVAVVSSNGYDGEREAKDFVKLLPGIGVCLSDSYGLKHKNYDEIVTMLNADKRLKAVIMFTTNEDSKAMISYAKQQNNGEHFLLLCVYGCTNYIEVVNGIEQEAEGILSVNLKPPELPEFEKYFINLKPKHDSSKYFNKSWEVLFNCSLTKNESVCLNNTFSEGHGYYPDTPVHTVINAVSVIAQTLRFVIEALCRPDRSWMFGKSRCVIDPSQPQLYSGHVNSILKKEMYQDGTLPMSDLLLPRSHSEKISYAINHYLRVNATYQNILVGTWDYTRNDQSNQGRFTFASSHAWHLNNGSFGKEEAICSGPCSAGHIRERDTNPQKQKCCWDCIRCQRNNVVHNDSCFECGEAETVNKFFNSCMPLSKQYIELNNNPALAFKITMSTVGLYCIVVVIAIIDWFVHQEEIYVM